MGQVEGLSRLLRKATEDNAIHGYHIVDEATPISHLLFANDTIIFCGAGDMQTTRIR